MKVAVVGTARATSGESRVGEHFQSKRPNFWKRAGGGDFKGVLNGPFSRNVPGAIVLLSELRFIEGNAGRRIREKSVRPATYNS